MNKNGKINAQTIGIIVISIMALIALITGFIISKNANKGKNTSKESTEILDSFYKYMGNDEEKIIYYGSSSCSYCELQTPIIEQIKEDYDIDYLYIDATKLSSDDKNEILKVLDVEGSTPTIAIVKDDSVIDVNVGYMDGKATIEFLKDNKILKDDATYKPEENLTFIGFNEYKDLVSKDDTTVIVIGQTTCSHCIAAKPVLSRVAGNYNITINYLNLTELSSDEQNELIESLKNLGYEDAENLGTPLTIIVKNKHIEGTIEGENPPSYFTRQFKKYGVITE